MLLRDASNAINGRNEPGKAEVKLRCRNGSLGRFHCRDGCRDLDLSRLNSGLSRLDLLFRGQIVLRSVVKVLLRDGLLLGERDVLVFIELRLMLIRFGRGKLRFRLHQLRVGLR